MIEPKRQDDLKLLRDQTRKKEMVLNIVLKEFGLKMKPFETIRAIERQKYLYAIGRTIKIGSKPVTWTLESKHIIGEAVDRVFIVELQPSRSGNRTLFRNIAYKCGLCKVPTGIETCHTQDNGVSISKTILKNSALWFVSNAQDRKILELVNKGLRAVK